MTLDLIISANATEAVKDSLKLTQAMKTERNSRIDPLSISFRSKK